MFFSPDPYVQAPGNWVNYNRYSYCINNPFRYTDKTGYWFGLDDLVVAGVGAIVGYASYGLTTGNWGWKAVAAAGVGAAIAWVGWNTMGAGVEGVKAMGLSASAVGHTATLAQAATAVFGANGLGYGTQVAVYTGLNSMAHKDQLKAADKKGWDGVAMMGAFTASSVLSYTLDPLSLKTSSTVQQFAGVVLTDNISDNMKDGELGLHTLHLGVLGYDFDKKEAYSIFSKGLSGDQRWDMGYETVLGLSLFQDVRIDYRTPKCQCGIDYLSPIQSYYVRLSYIANMANGILDTLDSYYMFTQSETAYQYWFNKKYNEDGTPNY